MLDAVECSWKYSYALFGLKEASRTRGFFVDKKQEWILFQVNRIRESLALMAENSTAFSLPQVGVSCKTSFECLKQTKQSIAKQVKILT
jgi:hypothetical protein